MTHEALVQHGVTWFRRQRYQLVFAEMTLQASPIIPDVIAWKSPSHDQSVLLECKVSRSDFRADQKKILHLNPYDTPGCERLYLTPPGLIQPAELPEGWGLLEIEPRGIKVVHRPAIDPKFVQSRRAKDVTMLVGAFCKMQNPDYSYDPKTGRFTFIGPPERKIKPKTQIDPLPLPCETPTQQDMPCEIL